MDHYPVFLNLKGRPVTIIGGGNVAERKVKSLLSAGSQITLVSPQITDNIQQWVNTKDLTFKQRKFQHADLNDAFLVVAATNDAAINSQIAAQAHAQNTLINVVDNPAYM